MFCYSVRSSLPGTLGSAILKPSWHFKTFTWLVTLLSYMAETCLVAPVYDRLGCFQLTMKLCHFSHSGGLLDTLEATNPSALQH